MNAKAKHTQQLYDHDFRHWIYIECPGVSHGDVLPFFDQSIASPYHSEISSLFTEMTKLDQREREIKGRRKDKREVLLELAQEIIGHSVDMSLISKYTGLSGKSVGQLALH